MLYFLLLIEKRNNFQIIEYCDFYDSIMGFVFDNFSESVAAHGLFYVKSLKKLT